MRILIVSNRYPPHIMGGYEVSCQLVADGLQERGYDVHVLTSTYGVNHRIVEGNVYRWLHLTWATPDVNRLAWWEVDDHWKMADLIKTFRPDVLFIWCALGIFPSLLKTLMQLEVPAVFHIQDIWLKKTLQFSQQWSSFWRQPGAGCLKQIVKRFIGRLLVQLCPEFSLPLDAADLNLDYAIFCSQFQKELHEYEGFVARNNAVIYNGVDTVKFYHRNGQCRHHLIKLLFVGRLCEEKGAHVALRALHECIQSGINNVVLSVVGIPQPPLDYYASLKNFVAQAHLDDYVVFMEPVNNNGMPDVYNEHDILVLPSFHQEGFSMVLLEAMACGLAIVGTTSGGSAEILRHGENCLTFPPGDVAALATQLERLIQDPALRVRLAKTGQQLVHERFTVQHMVDEIEQYLLQVVPR